VRAEAAYGLLWAYSLNRTRAGDLAAAALASGLAGRLRNAGVDRPLTSIEHRRVVDLVAPQRAELQKRYPWLPAWTSAARPSSATTTADRIRTELGRLAWRFGQQDSARAREYRAAAAKVSDLVARDPGYPSSHGRGGDAVFRPCLSKPSGADFGAVMVGPQLAEFRSSCGEYLQQMADALLSAAAAAHQVERGQGELLRTLVDDVGRGVQLGARKPGDPGPLGTAYDFWDARVPGGLPEPRTFGAGALILLAVVLWAGQSNQRR